MVPVVDVSAEKLYTAWTDVKTEVEKIGFVVAVTLSSNMRFFNNKLLKTEKDLYRTLESGR